MNAKNKNEYQVQLSVNAKNNDYKMQKINIFLRIIIPNATNSKTNINAKTRTIQRLQRSKNTTQIIQIEAYRLKETTDMNATNRMNLKPSKGRVFH